MSNIDWSKMITKEMKLATIAASERLVKTRVEDEWQKDEMDFIADQLIAIEDDDPDALPGTDREWRTYRTAVRAWKEGGNTNYPDKTKRPQRPA